MRQLAQVPQDVARDADEAEQQRRQNTVTAGMLILVGVAAIGLLLIAGALIWGAKVRRMLRPVDVERTRQDDLWYLRKGRPPADNEGAPVDEERSDSPRLSDTDDTRT